MDNEQLEIDSRLSYTIHLRYMAGALPLDSAIFDTREAKAYRLGYKVARQGNALDAVRWGVVNRAEVALFAKGYLAGKERV